MRTDLLAMAGFAGFVLMGLALLAVEAGLLPRGRRRLAVSGFLVYTLGLAVFAGLTQRDLWPFTAWTLVSGNVPQPWRTTRLVAVDAGGREFMVDPRAWEPLSVDELRAWLLQEFPGLDDRARDRVMADLLTRVNGARQRVREGRPPGTNARFLGPLTAPLFLLHPHVWQAPEDVPAEPFAHLRYYEETWQLDGSWQGEQTVRRRLLREYPRVATP